MAQVPARRNNSAQLSLELPEVEPPEKLWPLTPVNDRCITCRKQVVLWRRHFLRFDWKKQEMRRICPECYDKETPLFEN